MEPVEVVFETHSTSEDNERGIATGWNGGRLSKTGLDQARQLGERRRGDGIDTVYCSDLNRAVETAEIAFGDSGIPVVLDWRLRECNYGALNGMTREGLEAERLRRIDEPFPDGESWRAAVARVTEFLDELPAQHPGGGVLLIGHIATRWALEHRVLGQPLERLAATPFVWQEGWEYSISARRRA
jgi:broad specificity phosphatase PhoE